MNYYKFRNVLFNTRQVVCAYVHENRVIVRLDSGRVFAETFDTNADACRELTRIETALLTACFSKS
jgi:hypothetical protein